MAHYCHFWYKLGGCTCNSWVLDSRVQVTRGNKFARVRVPLLELKYSQVRVRVNSRVHSSEFSSSSSSSLVTASRFCFFFAAFCFCVALLCELFCLRAGALTLGGMPCAAFRVVRGIVGVYY